jgi:hypothetical protein
MNLEGSVVGAAYPVELEAHKIEMDPSIHLQNG